MAEDHNDFDALYLSRAMKSNFFRTLQISLVSHYPSHCQSSCADDILMKRGTRECCVPPQTRFLYLYLESQALGCLQRRCRRHPPGALTLRPATLVAPAQK